MSTHRIDSLTFSIDSTLYINNGSEKAGRVLYSDSNSGLVTWKSPSSIIGYSDHYVGEFYGGGIVVDVWKEGADEKILIMSLTDIGTSIWSNITTSSVNVDPNFANKSYGKSNISLILSQSGHIQSAAQLCKDYRSFSNRIPFTFDPTSFSPTGMATSGGFRYDPSTFTLYLSNLDSNGINIVNELLNWNLFNGITSASYIKTSYLSLNLIDQSNAGNGQSPAFYPILIFEDNYGNILNKWKIINESVSNLSTYLSISIYSTLNDSTSQNFQFNSAQSGYLYITIQDQGTIDYDDWYLPSGFELRKIFTNLNIINRLLGDEYGLKSGYLKGIGSGTSSNYTGYWTSSDSDIDTAYHLQTGAPGLSGSFGTITPRYKSSIQYVRAVRLEENITSDGILLNLDASKTPVHTYQPSKYFSLDGVRKSLIYPISSPYNTWRDISRQGKFINISKNTSVVEVGSYSSPSNTINYYSLLNSIGGNTYGGDAYIDTNIPVISKYTGTTYSTISVEMWARINTRGMLFSFGRYSVIASTASINNLSFNTAQSDLFGSTSSDIFNLDQPVWNHYVFEMNSGSYSNNKIYINGVTQSLSQISGTPNNIYANFNGVTLYGTTYLGSTQPGSRLDLINATYSGAGAFRIAGWPLTTQDTSFNTVWAGGVRTPDLDLSVVRVYGRSLTQDEIIKNFNENKYRFEILPSTKTKNLIVSYDANNINSYTSSNTWYNTNGTASNLSLNATTFNKSSRVYPGGTLQFDGISSYALSSTQISLTNSITIEVWINPSSLVSGLKIFLSQGLPYLSIHTNNKILFSSAYSGINQTYQYSKSSLKVGTWYHIVVTSDYNSVSGYSTSRIYINGRLDHENFITTVSSGSYDYNKIPGSQNTAYQSSILTLGAHNNNGAIGYYYTGQIANAKIYNKALSATEVKQNYDSERNKFETPRYSKRNGYVSHEIVKTTSADTFSITQNLVYNPNFSDVFSAGYGRFITSKGDNTGTIDWTDAIDPSSGLPNPILANGRTKLATKHYIGELFGGGIIVGAWRLNTTGTDVDQYLIASLTDVPNPSIPNSPATLEWGTYGSIGSNYWFGYGNQLYGEYNNNFIAPSSIFPTIGNISNTLVNYQGITASTIYPINYTENYNDWYLPSLSEMKMIYDSGHIINKVLGEGNLRSSGPYWTSTEDPNNSGNAYIIRMNSGEVSIAVKSRAYFVRPVRIFNTLSTFSFV